MIELLFDPPWWLIGILIGVGVVVFVTANNRREWTLRNVGVGIVLAGIALAIVGYFFQTDAERVTRSSRQLVRAVEQRDWDAMRALLDPQASVTVLDSITVYESREETVRGAELGVERFGLNSVYITSMETQPAGAMFVVTADLVTNQSATLDRPLRSSWQFEWHRTDDGWVATRIINLRIGHLTGDRARVEFPVVRLEQNSR